MTDSNCLPTECDVVMEGGITSGVVYPRFIAGLAARFTLRSIGGTSVGAIAAVAAAAAQFSKNLQNAPNIKIEATVADSFATLENLPEWLRDRSALGHSNLFTLFQPCPELERHFRIIQAALNRTGKAKVVGASALALLRHFPLGALAGAVFSGSARFAVSLAVGLAPSVLGLLIFAVIGAFVGAILEFALSGWKGLKHNRIGFCSGLRSHEKNPPALTEWLHEYVQTLSGLPTDQPLTFGSLVGSSPPIELALMTTGLSELRAHRLPYTSRDLVFRLADIELLFPPAIVAWMVMHSRDRTDEETSGQDDDDSRDRTRALLKENDPSYGTKGQQYFRMPAPQDLPIVVAARMSLSFPILLQAIPLYRMRYAPGPAGTKGTVALKRIWFSDGGLTSNFPIHFFDALLPTRPTFGVTLDNSLPSGASAQQRVFLPTNNRGGITEAYFDLGTSAGDISPLAFLGALLRTIRTWRDEALKRTPGYRDRVVQIFHTKEEGGLNLDMPPDAIKVMSDSGAHAADLVLARFLEPTYDRNGWASHRWIRMRCNGAVLQKTIGALSFALTSSTLQPSYRQMWAAATNHAFGYKLSAPQRDDGAAFWNALDSAQIGGATSFQEGGPLALPTLVIAPRQT